MLSISMETQRTCRKISLSAIPNTLCYVEAYVDLTFENMWKTRLRNEAPDFYGTVGIQRMITWEVRFDHLSLSFVH